MSEAPEIIGLTGGIATGKSTVSRMLTALGVRVIDADIVAREVVEVGEPALEEIRAQFGDDVLASDGALNREALGERIFADPAARTSLNAITHPRIAMRMMEHAHQAGAEGFPWVVYDAALIVENGLHHALAGLIVVACAPSTQLQRLMKRDGLSLEQAEQRVASQMPIEEKVTVADWVVRNDGTLEQTEQRVHEVCEALVQRFGPLHEKV